MNDTCAYASLLEYDSIKGRILSTEVSKKKDRFAYSIKKHLKVGKEEPLKVIKVDRKRKIIELSKR